MLQKRERGKTDRQTDRQRLPRLPAPEGKINGSTKPNYRFSAKGATWLGNFFLFENTSPNMEKFILTRS
jgi:hypothetical protein